MSARMDFSSLVSSFVRDLLCSSRVCLTISLLKLVKPLNMARQSSVTAILEEWEKLRLHWDLSFGIGNQAPDEECIILSAIYKQKDLFEQYQDEASLPRIARSTFYRLFRLKFGPYREDKELPHIRISSYSSHSRCDTCLLLEKYKMTCKTEEERVLLRSMEQRHKQTYQKSYQSIQEKRYQAIYDPINYIHIQGKETFAKRVFFKVKINLAQWLVQLQSLGFLYVICYLSNISDVDRLSYYNVTTRLVDLVGLCWFKQNLTEKIC